MDAITDVGDLDEEPLEITTQPDPVIVDESPEHQRARAPTDVPPGQSDEEYWVETINQTSITPYCKPQRLNYGFGALITSNFCLAE